MPLLVSGTFRNGLFIVSGLGAAFFLTLGTVQLIHHATMDCCMLAITILPAVFTASYGLVLLRRRTWVEVTTTGFVLWRRGRRQVFTYEQVESIAHHVRVGDDGEQKCRLILTVGADRRRIECPYSVGVGSAAPLAGLVSRLVAALAARVERGLEGGAVLKGNGWSLDARGLHVRDDVYPLGALTFAGFYDGHLCIWMRDQERPSLRLPRESRNVLPLGEILNRRSGGRPDESTPPSDRSFGRLLLERRPSTFYCCVAGVCICALLFLVFLFLAALVMFDREAERNPNCLFAPLLLGLLTGAIGLLTWRQSKSQLWFHERGVIQTWAGSVARLPYAEIDRVVWGHFLALEPYAGALLPSIMLPFAAWKLKDELAVRDLVCQPLARRWAERLASGPVRWTERLRFLSDSLEVATALDAGPDSDEPFRREFVTIPYDNVSCRLERGHFLLFVLGQERPLCKEPLTSPNFYVGLQVLEWLWQGHSSQPPSGAGESVSHPTAAGDARVMLGPAEGVTWRDNRSRPET